MIPFALRRRKIGATLRLLVVAAALVLLLTGCLEQYQSTRIASGSLANFLIHLEHGELDDALAYFAPGLVTPSAQLDSSIKDASDRLQAYEIKVQKYDEPDIGNGEKQVTASGQVRKRTPVGQPTPGPDEGWQQTDIVTARMVERGPGWRILDFELKCCPK
jgi:hypothetical protein